MTELQLKYMIGIVLILSHIVVIFEIIWFRFTNGFNTDEFTTLLAVVGPIFSGFTTSIIAFVVANKHVLKDTSKPVTKTFVSLTVFFPILLTALVITSIAVKAYNHVFSDFEDFKRILIVLESIFAANVGMLVYSLFPRQPVPVQDFNQINSKAKNKAKQNS